MAKQKAWATIVGMVASIVPMLFPKTKPVVDVITTVVEPTENGDVKLADGEVIIQTAAEIATNALRK